MPWENRFQVGTTHQANAYRQLIQKEQMRRRNETAILTRYRFRDQVTSLEGLGNHWDGNVVHPRTGALSPPADIVSPRRSAATPEVSEAPQPVVGTRALLQVQSRSTVLREGYDEGRTTTGGAAYCLSSSVNADGFDQLNPEAKQPQTLARVRQVNQQKYDDALARRYQREAQQRVVSREEMLLRRRLIEANLPVDAALPSRPTHGSTKNVITADSDPNEGAALGDVRPTKLPAANKSQAGGQREEKKAYFGLRSFGRPARLPGSAALQQELDNQARQVFEPISHPDYVTESRRRLQESLQQKHAEADSRSPSRLQAARLERPSTAAALSRSVDREAADAEESIRRVQEKANRVAELEALLENTRTEREQMRGTLVQLCDLVEKKLNQPPATSVARPVEHHKSTSKTVSKIRAQTAGAKRATGATRPW